MHRLTDSYKDKFTGREYMDSRLTDIRMYIDGYINGWMIGQMDRWTK